MAPSIQNTKHFKVSKMLGEQIRFLSVGEMIPTVAALKDQYQASQATITKALDRLRQQGVVERPPGKKRLVVAPFAVRPDFRVTLIRPLWCSPDYDAITNQIYELGLQKNFAFAVHVFSSYNDLNLEQALHNSDAGIVIGNVNLNAQTVDAFRSFRKPIVFLREMPEKVNRDSIWVDDFAVGRLAAQHLLKLGHERILIMLSEPPNPSMSMRMQGWRSAMEKAGVEHVAALVCDCSVPPGRDAVSGSYDRFSSWLDGGAHSFTAVFCVAWTGALAVLRALRERGIRVPEDVSAIAFSGESSLCEFTSPPLTTLEIDLHTYMNEAVRLIAKNIEPQVEGYRPENIRLKPFLVERQSTARPLPGMGVHAPRW